MMLNAVIVFWGFLTVKVQTVSSNIYVRYDCLYIL